MNELYKDKLKILSQDEIMLTAIKSLFTERIEKDKPVVLPTDDDKILGEKYRAYEQAKKLLNEIILDIEAYNTNNIKSDLFNKGK